jgi:glucuronokinase
VRPLTPASAAAPARAALAGNPSDGYGGRTLAVALEAFAARVEVLPADGVELGPLGTEPLRLASIAGLDAALHAGGGTALMAAAVRRFARFAPLHAGFALRFSSTIPGEVGLGGSSALVIAALRALAATFAVELAPDTLAMAALAAETEELGIAAGPQDRVVQAYGGLLAMDFAGQHGPGGAVERLDPALLPPLFVAWRPTAAACSGEYHTELRRRYERGDPPLVEGMRRLAELAAQARDALVSRDEAAFRRSVIASFDVRRSMGGLVPEHVRMVDLARTLGASANYAGSGGAIVGTIPPGITPGNLCAAFEREGCAALAPVRPTGSASGPSG